MEQNELIVVALFALVAVATLLTTYLDKSRYAAVLEQFAGMLFVEADTALAPYGDKLKAIHDAATVLQSLVDEDTDTLHKHLPPGLAQAVLRTLSQVAELTDGEVEPESIGDAEAAPQAEQS